VLVWLFPHPSWHLLQHGLGEEPELHGYLKTGIYVRRLPRKVIQSMARFRLRSHKLRIETGRHKRPREAREDRIYTRCRILSEEMAPIDDEHHLLFDCQATAGIRQRYVGLQATNLWDLMQHPDQFFRFGLTPQIHETKERLAA
jgi:hypothetical protein